jgi:hypothetical protein
LPSQRQRSKMTNYTIVESRSTAMPIAHPKLKRENKTDRSTKPCSNCGRLDGRPPQHGFDAGHPALPITRSYLYPGIEIDDVLPAGRRMPVDVVFGLGLAEDDTGGWQAL